MIVETYLEVARQLRAAGSDAPSAFASSNTNDYYAAGSSHLADDLAQDLKAVPIEFAPSFGAAAHVLGIRA